MSSQEVRKKYSIPDKIKLTIEITLDGWFLVRAPELPGLATQARNAKELLEMVNDAILTYYDVPEKEAKSAFDSIKIEGFGVIANKINNQVLAVN